jgi:hypothetical protein
LKRRKKRFRPYPQEEEEEEEIILLSTLMSDMYCSLPKTALLTFEHSLWVLLCRQLLLSIPARRWKGLQPWEHQHYQQRQK